jgi:hypothetical protein
MLYSLLFSASDAQKRDSTWILWLLSNGLKSIDVCSYFTATLLSFLFFHWLRVLFFKDYQIFKRRHTFDFLISVLLQLIVPHVELSWRYVHKLVTRCTTYMSMFEQLLKIIYKATFIPVAIKDLIQRCGLFPWLLCVCNSFAATTNYFLAILRLLKRILVSWYLFLTVTDHFRWSKYAFSFADFLVALKVIRLAMRTAYGGWTIYDTWQAYY